MTAEEIFNYFAEKSRELTDRTIADLTAKIDALNAASIAPRIVRCGFYVGELSPDGREIALAHGVVVVPANAIVTTATPEESKNFQDFREETRAALKKWYDEHNSTGD